MTANKPQNGRHDVKRPIRYHGPDKKYTGKLVSPGEAILTFPHLDDEGYALLLRRGVITPHKESK